MVDDLVMRSVYLRSAEDGQLRQLAHELNVSKSDLIRSAVSVKLREWLESNSDELVLNDLKSGQLESVAHAAAGEAVTVEPAVTRPTAKKSGPNAPARGAGVQVIKSSKPPAEHGRVNRNHPAR